MLDTPENQIKEYSLMTDVVNTRIKAFGTSPKADIVPPDDPILEIPLSEFQGLLEEMVLTHNQIAEMIRDAGILRGRELSKMVTRPRIASRPQDHQWRSYNYSMPIFASF